MRLTLRTRDSELVTDLFGGGSAVGSTATIIDNVQLELVAHEKPTSLLPLSQELIEILIKVGSGVSAALIADWIRKIRRRADEVEIEKKSLEIYTKDSLVRLIEEKTSRKK